MGHGAGGKPSHPGGPARRGLGALEARSCAFAALCLPQGPAPETFGGCGTGVRAPGLRGADPAGIQVAREENPGPLQVLGWKQRDSTLLKS